MFEIRPLTAIEDEINNPDPKKVRITHIGNIFHVPTNQTLAVPDEIIEAFNKQIEGSYKVVETMYTGLVDWNRTVLTRVFLINEN